MKKHIRIALTLSVMLVTCSSSTIYAKSANKIAEFKPTETNKTDVAKQSLEAQNAIANAVMRFANPAVMRFGNGCSTNNLDENRFAQGMSDMQKVSFCNAIDEVSKELNRTNWSPELRNELQNIWRVFLTKNIKLRPVRNDMPGYFALASEPFTRGEGLDFNATVYVRPEYSHTKLFFLMAMHELRHIYDFYELWESGKRLSEGEMEMRGFLIMGRIARETSAKEKFSRLPKVWKDSWSRHNEQQIEADMYKAVSKFLLKHPFYKDRIKNPDRYLISFARQRALFDQTQNDLAKLDKNRVSIETKNNNEASKFDAPMNLKNSSEFVYELPSRKPDNKNAGELFYRFQSKENTNTKQKHFVNKLEPNKRSLVVDWRTLKPKGKNNSISFLKKVQIEAGFGFQFSTKTAFNNAPNEDFRYFWLTKDLNFGHFSSENLANETLAKGLASVPVPFRGQTAESLSTNLNF
ncbi:MAG: hypothetical protein ACK5NT_03790 [Pyrinomonadaceae bacterium]